MPLVNLAAERGAKDYKLWYGNGSDGAARRRHLFAAERAFPLHVSTARGGDARADQLVRAGRVNRGTGRSQFLRLVGVHRLVDSPSDPAAASDSEFLAVTESSARKPATSSRQKSAAAVGGENFNRIDKSCIWRRLNLKRP
jgi:hypothetical protein